MARSSEYSGDELEHDVTPEEDSDVEGPEGTRLEKPCFEGDEDQEEIRGTEKQDAGVNIVKKKGEAVLVKKVKKLANEDKGYEKSRERHEKKLKGIRNRYILLHQFTLGMIGVDR